MVVLLLGAGNVRAQTSTANVTLEINTVQSQAASIPNDFSGLSFEMGSVIYNNVYQGWYLSGTNAAMVALMKTMGVKSIRVGGNSAESGNIATNADEDAVLDFCNAIGGNLIWDLEIDGSLYDPPGKAAIAQSMQNYVNSKGYTNGLVFQVGNEPDLMPDPNDPGHNMSVTTYDSEFSNYVAAVNGLYLGSQWAGPDTAAGGTFYSATFCPSEAAAWPGQIEFCCQHDYPFGSSLDTNTTAVHISWMLAASDEAGYQSFNNQWVPYAVAAGLAPRYEECNSFFHNGSWGASDSYASALWGLGWMYFQAQAGLAGVNFHIGLDSNDAAYDAIDPANLTNNYTVRPLAYAIKAFDLGGHGHIVPVTVGNSSNMNLVAYSVLQNDGSLMVTVINREYTNQPTLPVHNAALNITTSGTTYNDGQVMFLTGMNNDPATTNGVTLGGSAISGQGVWTGTYMGMAAPSGSSFTLPLPASQAAIIHLFTATGPAAPTNLTATTGNSQATLTWSNSVGANGYLIQRANTTGGPYATIANGVTTNTYTDTGLTNGLIYYYVVAATNSSSVGPQSAEVIASLSTAPPLSPSGLTAVPGDSVVALNWNASAGATNYILQISTNSDGSNPNLVFTVNTSYLNMGLNNGATYYYAVSATGPYGQSPLSATVSATPFVSEGIAWTNTITTSAQNWNANSNWNGAVFPNGTQAVALVNSPITANQTINLNQSTTIGELNIGASSGAGSFNIAGNGGTLTLDNTPGSPSVMQLGSSAGDTISAPLSFNDNLNLYNASPNSLTLSGNITSTNYLVVNSGTVVLGATTTFNGTATVAQGTLQLANSLALQDSTLNLTNGSVTFNGISAATLGGLSGTQNLNLVNTASMPLALTIGANNLNTIYRGALIGSGSLTKSGSGTLTLIGTNTYNGNTTVLASSLTVAGGTINAPDSTIAVGNGSTGVSLSVTGGMVTAATLNIAPIGGSTGDNASITGSGSAIFNSVNLGSSGNTSGPLTISTTGSVALGNLTDYKDVQGNGPVSTAGVILKAGTVTATSVIIQDTGSAGDLNISGGSLTIGNTLSTGAFEVGNGASSRGGWLTMTGGSLTYLGKDGLLMMLNSSSEGEANISGGIATLTGITLNEVNAAGAASWLVLSGGATLYLGNVGLVINQPSATAYASLGTATVGAVTNWSSVAPITLSGSTTFQAADASGAIHNITLSSALSGTGSLLKTGGGTLTLNGTNTYVGSSIVNAGTLAGTGSIAGAVTINSGGMIAPGNPLGTLTISNNLSLAAGSSTYMQVQHSPLTNTAVKITGTLVENGALIVTNSNATVFAGGDSFKLFNAANYSGAFTNFILPALPTGLEWNISALNTSGTLSVVALSTPSIANVSIVNGNLVVSGTNGTANWTYYMLAATNLVSPQWVPISTNQFDGSGNFSVTNTIDPTAQQTFYKLRLL